MDEIINNAAEIMTADIPDNPDRSIEVITAEIVYLKNVAGFAIVEIGNRLIEAKGKLPHGEWGKWLSENVQFTQKSAERYMKLAEGYSKFDNLSILGASKALKLLELEPIQREAFIEEKHDVNGEEKTVYDMTNKELSDALAKLSEAENRAKEEEQLRKDAEEQADEYNSRIEELEAEIEKLKNAPKEVTAIETVADHAAEEKLKAEIEALKNKVEDLKREARGADEKTEKKLKEEKERAKKLSEQLAAANESLAKLRKESKAAGDGDMASFKVYFEQCQKNVEAMAKIINGLKSSGREEDSAKLTNAYKALFDAALKSI